jgi:hypothetical protein
MRAGVRTGAQRSPHGRQAGRGGSRSPLQARRASVHRGARGAHPKGDDDTQDRDRHGGRRKRHPEDGRHADAPAHVCQPPGKYATRRPRGVASWQHQAQTSHARYTVASAQRAVFRPRAASPPPRTRPHRPFLQRRRVVVWFVGFLHDAAQARPSGEEGGESGE